MTSLYGKSRIRSTLAATTSILLLVQVTGSVVAQSTSAEWITLNSEVLELLSIGEYERAASVGKKAIEVAEKSFGSDHRFVGTSISNLGIVYYSQGNHDKAETLLRRALAIYEKTLRSDHPDIAKSLDALGLVYYSAGRFTEAEPLLKRALAIREEKLRPNDLNLASSFNNLGTLYFGQGNYSGAEKLFKRALAIYDIAAEPNDPNWSQAVENLAFLIATVKKVAPNPTSQSKANTQQAISSTRSHSTIQYHNQIVNGRTFQVGTYGDIQIWNHLTIGKELELATYVVNGSGQSVLFDPERIKVVALRPQREQNQRTELTTFSAAEYEKKVSRRNAWILGLSAVGTGLSNLPSAQTSSVSGTYTTYGSTGSGWGSFNGRITTWPTAQDYSAANARTQAQISLMQGQLESSLLEVSNSLLRVHTMMPNSYYGGIVYVKKRKAESYKVSIPFDGMIFDFTWRAS